jgi:ribosome-dependent ATPase
MYVIIFTMAMIYLSLACILLKKQEK